MAFAPLHTITDEILDFLASAPSPANIIAFQPSKALIDHSRYLLERNREGKLTMEESAELEEFTRMNHFMSMLKIRARQKMIKK